MFYKLPLFFALYLQVSYAFDPFNPKHSSTQKILEKNVIRIPETQGSIGQFPKQQEAVEQKCNMQEYQNLLQQNYQLIMQNNFLLEQNIALQHKLQWTIQQGHSPFIQVQQTALR